MGSIQALPSGIGQRLQGVGRRSRPGPVIAVKPQLQRLLVLLAGPVLGELGRDGGLTRVGFQRIEQLAQIRRSSLWYHQAIEVGLPILPDIGWSLWEPDGRLWAEWVNGQPGLRAVSIFCGGKRIHAEGRAHRETVEDIALFHQAVRPAVAFVVGGVHSPRRLLDYRRAAPGRRLAVCNGQAYALAQRRRLLSGEAVPGGLSTRECFLRNCSWIEEAVSAVLGRR